MPICPLHTRIDLYAYINMFQFDYSLCIIHSFVSFIFILSLASPIVLEYYAEHSSFLINSHHFLVHSSCNMVYQLRALRKSVIMLNMTYDLYGSTFSCGHTRADLHVHKSYAVTQAVDFARHCAHGRRHKTWHLVVFWPLSQIHPNKVFTSIRRRRLECMSMLSRMIQAT